jgi:hypothetical protein
MSAASLPTAGPFPLRRAVRAEWTKLRTLRGWVVAILLAGALIDLVGLVLVREGIGCGQLSGKDCYQPLPTGPGGQAVTDAFYFAHRPLTGDGGITVRMTALTGHYANNPGPVRAGQPDVGLEGTQPWSKAGIILKSTTTPGSAYAAMTATGSHGTRMQWNFTHDVAGLPGAVDAAAPRWLRLTRAGDTITGYDSVDGVTWTKIASARLAGLPATVQLGLFATSPGTLVINDSFGGSSVTGGPSTATGSFDHIAISGTTTAAWVGTPVTGDGTPGQLDDPNPRGSYEMVGDKVTVTGTGDIAPAVPGQSTTPGSITTLDHRLVGLFIGLIVLVVVAAMVATSEYRRGLVRVTLAAIPDRGRLLAAKAAVVGTVTFAVGLVATALAVVEGSRLTRDEGMYVLPVSAATEARVIVGVALVLAVCAVFAVAVGMILRRGAAAVAAAVVVVVLPYLLGTAPGLPDAMREWLLRITPAAGFAIEDTIPHYTQITARYPFPLGPWAGFAVLCGYAGAALAVAYLMLRRRDA